MVFEDLLSIPDFSIWLQESTTSAVTIASRYFLRVEIPNLLYNKMSTEPYLSSLTSETEARNIVVMFDQILDLKGTLWWNKLILLCMRRNKAVFYWMVDKGCYRCHSGGKSYEKLYLLRTCQTGRLTTQHHKRMCLSV